MNKYKILPVARWKINNQSSEIKWEVKKKFLCFWINIGGKWQTQEEASIYLKQYTSQILGIKNETDSE